METSELELGSVFRLPSPSATEPNRVLLVDKDVVIYDAWWSHRGSWGMADPVEVQRGAWNYYVTLVSTMLEKAEYVRTEPLSPAEVALHRPDLPFAIGQNAAASWSSDQTTAAAQAWKTSDGDVVIAVAQVYLSPFGPQGGHKRAVRVQAENGTSFTTGELIRKAAVVQAPHIKDERPAAGVGVYRSGLIRGIPSYYLWGAESRLHQHVREYFESRRAATA
jgi:hypothetical protein